MATKKGKQMTARKKELAAEARAELREKGLMPPVKKPLNRKKYVDKAKKIYEEESKEYDFTLYLVLPAQEPFIKQMRKQHIPARIEPPFEAS